MRSSCCSPGEGRFALCPLLLALFCAALLAVGCGRRVSTGTGAARVVSGHHEQPIGQRAHNERSAVGFTSELGCYVAYEEEEEVPPIRRAISFGTRQPAARVVFNGQPSPWFEQIVWMGFPFDDERFFFVARAGNRMFVYQGLRQIGTYDEVGSAFDSSKDGKTVAYAARRGKQWFIVRNGQERPVSGGAVTDLVLSPDGSKTAYVVEQGGKQTIIADEMPVGSYQKATLYFISNDGKRLVYEVKQAGKGFLVADGKQTPPYTLLRWLSLADDGRVQAYVAQVSGKEVVVWHGRRSSLYDMVGTPSLSGDGKQIAYPAKIGNRWTIVVNGQKRGSYEQVASVQVSEDGNLVTAAVQDGGRWFVLANGHREGAYDSIEPNLSSHHMPGPYVGMASRVTVAAGSRRVGYVAEVGGKWFVVVDGKRSAPYDHAYPPVFSRDGAHVAFLAVKGGRGLVVLDGKEGPQYDYIAAGPVFRKDGSLEYLAVRGETLYRVTVPLK